VTDWADLDKRTLWHPFTQMREWASSEVLVVAAGDGPYLIDTDGRRYLDGVSSLWTNVHGHRHPGIDRAVREQLGRIAHTTLLGLASVPSIEYAAKLRERLPRGLTRVFYSDNGSTAVEVALKIAFHYRRHQGGAEARRTKFLTFEGGYHGDTIGAVSLGGIDLFHETYRPLLFPSFRAHYPYCYRCPLGLSHPACGLACAEDAEGILAAHGDEICAAVIEPLVQGAAGMRVAPEGFLARIAKACAARGVHLIADEVATGFGRTGRLFACEWEDVSPDLMCLAKGITGGYLPLAVTAAREEIHEAFLGPHESMRQFFHGHTYTGNPLACAAAIASLAAFDDGVLASLPGKCEDFADALGGLRDRPHVGDVRVRGLMAGIELVADRATKRPYGPTEKVGVRVVLEARRRGLVIRPLGDVIVLMPPPCCDGDVLREIVALAGEAIGAVTEG
jgi:adenosylmethionine-8-amino-7-oxononanoate aminotransferase